MITYEMFDGYVSENRRKVKLNGKWGYADKLGNQIGEIIYDKVDNFKNGFGVVTLNNKQGYVNEQDTVLGHIQYDEVNDFENDGFAKIRLNGIKGWIDKDGTVYMTESKEDANLRQVMENI